MFSAGLLLLGALVRSLLNCKHDRTVCNVCLQCLGDMHAHASLNDIKQLHRVCIIIFINNRSNKLMAAVRGLEMDLCMIWVSSLLLQVVR